MSIHRIWPEIEPLFERALQLDPQQRAEWLAELGATLPDMAQVVRELIAKQEALDAGGFLRGSVFEKFTDLSPALHQILAQRVLGATAEPGQLRHAGFAADGIVGPYRLIREIGHGGMSSVWLAEHSDGQLQREVALKLPFLGQRMQVERFLRERNILAALTHPRIARLYDAGFSESGQPYLAMEYVAGAALLNYCDQRQLSISQRLQVFLQVLEAVQFAHARLIIHRDLKPSNILVAAEGSVALLDFGIGKLLSDDTTGETQLTQLSGRALTPEYASPEQIAGEALGIGSDIYSLGVILFELLTGTPPYRLQRNSRAALEEAILSEAVRWPSHSEISATAATARGSSVRALASLLAGDLDAIVIKALKKNPAERYPSVTAFAQDIAHHLQHLPVSAQPDSYRYRLGKFLARHRVPVAAASFALCALLVGATIALWQARAASAQSDRALASASQSEAISHFFDTILTEAAFAEKPVTVRELLARGAKLALENSRGNPESRAAVLGMIASEYESLFELEPAQQLADAALSLLASSRERSLKSKLRCLRAYIVALRGDPDAGIAQIKSELPEVGDDALTASACLNDLAHICADTPQACPRGDSLRYADQALALVRSVPNPTDITLGTEAALLAAVAYGHHLDGDNRKADRFFAQAVQKYAEIGRQDSTNGLNAKLDWAVVTEQEGRPKDALKLYEDTLRLDAQRDPDAQPATITLSNKARALTAIGRFTEARSTFELLCRLSEAHDDGFSRPACLLGSASLAIQSGAPPTAQEFLERAARLLATDHAADDPLVFMLAALEGQYELAQGHIEAARAHFDRVLSQGNGTAPMVTLLGMAELELAAGNPNKALDLARRALELARSTLGEFPYSQHVGRANLLLGRALQQLDQPTPARAAFQEALTHLSNTVDAEHPALVQARQRFSVM